MKAPESENLLAICLVAGCTQTLGKLWSDSCAAMLEALVQNVGNSLSHGAAEAVGIKGLPRSKTMQTIAMKGGRGL